MSPEERELLRRSIALAEENNDILRSIQSSMRIARLTSLLYWIFIIGATVGAYYFIQPYLDQLLGMYRGTKIDFQNMSGGVNDLLDTVKQFKVN